MQIGLLVVTTGAAGELGSDKLTGPAAAEAQKPDRTVMEEYIPTDKLSSNTLPVVPDNMVSNTKFPFWEYVT
jgi:hypothetical protein